MTIAARVFIALSVVTLVTLGMSQLVTLLIGRASMTGQDFIVVAIALLALISLETWVLCRAIAAPLHVVTRRLNQLADDPVQPSDDVAQIQQWAARQPPDAMGEVAQALQRVETVMGHIGRSLEHTQAVKERMASELNIGREIQMNLLTLTFPAFPKRKNLNLHATLKPAREVSGDFYDFYFYREGKSYLLEANRFCFCVGDVSGKGVPAALFMAVIKILLKSQADQTASPAAILTHVNQVVSADNPSCMFVTLFFGILNLVNGELVYTNAGHNPPYLQHPDGELEHLKQRHGPALGVAEGWTYQESKITLKTDDLLIVFTDGVTEAMDSDENLFSEQRLVDVLTSKTFCSAEEVIHHTTEAVHRFQGDAEQADDLTMLCLKFLGQATTREQERLELFKTEILSSLQER